MRSKAANYSIQFQLMSKKTADRGILSAFFREEGDEWLNADHPQKQDPDRSLVNEPDAGMTSVVITIGPDGAVLFWARLVSRAVTV